MKQKLDNYLQYDNVLQDFIDLAEEYYVQIDCNYFIIDCNLKFCEFRNTRRTNILGSAIIDFMNPDDQLRFIKNLKKFDQATEENNSTILSLFDYKNRPRKSVMHILGIKDYNEELCGYFLKFAKYHERTEDSRFVSTMKSMLDSLSKLYTVVSTKLDGRIITINSLVPTILGYSEEELIGSNINKLYDDSDENKNNFIVMQQSLKEKGYFVGEIIQIAKNGTRIPIYLSVTNLMHNGLLIGRLGVGRDLREVKKLEAENKSFAIKLETQAKLVEFGMMIQGVAHNLNTPLTGIKSSAQLMKAKLAKFYDLLLASGLDLNSDPVIEKMHTGLTKTAEMINSSSEKLTKIISNMMAKARQEQSRLKEELNLSIIMEQELEFLMANMFFKHKIEKIFSLQKDLPIIYGIYSDFSQTFVNLIKNAMDAMYNSDKKILEINILADTENIFVKIRDTGHGIPQDIKSRIFDPFFTTKPRINEGKPGEPTGTGLGLENAISLLKPYYASLTFTTEVNMGTEFVITIPIVLNKNKNEQLKVK